MRSSSKNSAKSFLSLHASGFIIGLYFLSLQFVASINLSYLILLAGFLLLLATQPLVHWRRLLSGASLIALLLFFSTVVSAHWAAAAVVKPAIAISQIPGLLVFAMVVLFVRSERQLSGVIGAFLLVLLFTAEHFFLASYRADWARGIALIFHAAHPLYLAANDVLMLAIPLPLVIWFCQSLNGLAGRLLLIGYILLLVLLSTLLLSRISLLIVLASLVFYFGFNRQLSKLWPVLFALLLAGLAAYYFDTGLAAKLQSLDLTRLRVWIVAGQMFVDAPWLGHGPGSYSVLYSQYLAHSDVALQYGHEGRNMGWAHNLFFEAAAEKGLLGLSVALLYFIYLIAALRRKQKDAPSALGRALLLSVIMCLAAACVELTMLRVWVIYIVYLLLGLVAVFTSPREREISAAPTP